MTSCCTGTCTDTRGLHEGTCTALYRRIYSGDWPASTSPCLGRCDSVDVPVWDAGLGSGCGRANRAGLVTDKDKGNAEEMRKGRCSFEYA